jgi:hypothetical protein
MWIATLKDGRKVSSSSSKWGDIKDEVISLGYTHRGILHSLPSGQTGYFFFNSASANINGGRINVESRVIGCTLSNKTIISMRFHEGSGDVVVEYKES